LIGSVNTLHHDPMCKLAFLKKALVKELKRRQIMEKGLSEYRVRLKCLAKKLIDKERRERHLIASELHDGVVQDLAGICIRLNFLRCSASSAELLESIDEIKNAVTDALCSIRSLISESSQHILEVIGFEKAVKKLIEKFTDNNDLIIDFNYDNNFKLLDKNIENLVFRSIKELLNNVVKHSKATKANLSIKIAGEQLRIEIQDNGIGIKSTGINHLIKKNGGFGLFSIQEMVSYLDGHFNIESKTGNGMRVTLVIPLVKKH